jgi:hypothetical protein
MSIIYRCLAITVVVAGVSGSRVEPLRCGQNQSRQSQAKSAQQTAQPGYRPTLGAPPDQHSSLGYSGPGLKGSLAGPHEADINDPKRLLTIHSIFVARMDNDLARNLTQRISEAGTFSIASDRHHADAVLHGTCFDSVHLKTLHSEVFLSTPNGVPIWQDVVRQPYRPAALRQAVATTADAITTDLRASVRVAERQ